MKKLILLILIAHLLSSCTTKPEKTATTANDSSEVKEPNQDWIPLFDGKTTAGWHTYGKNTIGKAWKMENGILHLDASQKNDWQTANGGDIVTDEEYENFDLQLEWKISEKGNSGILFYVMEDAAKYEYAWYTGPEMQVADNAGNEDGKIVKHMAGDLYDLIAVSGETVNPAGEWNQVRIVSNKGNLDLYMNGKQVLTTTLWDDSWKNLINNSKFKTMPDFGTFKKGRIGLQDHGNDVWFRNVRIRKL